MATPVTVPRLGWNMEQGVFVGWLKADGAAVRAGEPLFTLEGEKATEDVEGFESGVLHIPADGPRPGDVVPVGAVIGFVLQPGEAVPSLSPAPAPKPEAVMATEAKAEVAVAPARDRPCSSPRARRAAARLGVDLAMVPTTGRTGRIRERDVLALAETNVAGTRSVPVGPIVAGTLRVPAGTHSVSALHSPLRRVIAERMVHSRQTTAPVTLTMTADATNLVRRRQQFAEQGPAVPSYTDFLVKFAALALEQHPALNARWENEGIVFNEGIHIGVAVDTERGLLVPVIRDVPRLTLHDVAVRSRDLSERARQGKLASNEMRGGTFTVTSLGAFGIDAFTPIIRTPECAILGVGRIRRVPAVVDDRVVIRDQVTLSLTFDHRITDGAPAARFLQTLCAALEQCDL